MTAISSTASKNSLARPPRSRRVRASGRQSTTIGEAVHHEEIEYIQVRDNKTFNEGVRNLITLHGYHGRALDTTGEDENAQRTMRNVTTPQSIVEIGMVEKLPDEEWQRRYQETLAESNADEKANAMLRDLEKRVAEREAQERTHKLP